VEQRTCNECSAASSVARTRPHPLRIARSHPTTDPRSHAPSRITRLVDDLLDVSRITSGKITLQRERVAVAAVIAQAAETARPAAESRRETLEVDVPDDVGGVEGDPARLVQAVGNLLDNAIKYTEEGGHIRLTARVDGPEVVAVDNDGPGAEGLGETGRSDLQLDEVESEAASTGDRRLHERVHGPLPIVGVAPGGDRRPVRPVERQRRGNPLPGGAHGEQP